jgi:hypothetical protein
MKNMTTQTMTRVDSFEPEKGDTLLDTKTWEESQSPFTINYTERTFRRITEDKIQTICVINKRFTGPSGPIQRLGWKKFGAAATGESCTTVKGDVYLEFVRTDSKWIPNGIYINAAKKDNWSQNEINQIIRSDRPDIVYRKLQKSKVDTHLASLRLKFEHVEAEDTKPAAPEPEPDPSVKMGLRERMLYKQRNRVETETTPSAKPNSLSARMNQRRDDAKQQHDDQLCTLFLQNIPEDYSEADIKTHIQDYKFRRVNIVRRDGESIGKAFIELESTEETQGCLEAINGQKWGYCVIEVQLSKPKPKPTDDESKSSKPKSKSKPKPNSSSSSNFKKPKPRSAGRH